MTSQEIAAFTISNDFYMWAGLILGLVISGFFKTLLNFASHRFERPRRIRFRNMNGRHERNDNFEYLYLYKNDYYTLEQRDFLVQERLKHLRSISPLDIKFITCFSSFLVISIITIFYLLISKSFLFSVN